MRATLTPKEKAFVREYLVDLNQTAAAKRAGYGGTHDSSKQLGAKLMRKAGIKRAIKQAMDARAKRTNVTADRVLEEIARIAFVDVRELFNEDGTLKNPRQLGAEVAAALSSIDVSEVGGGDAPVSVTKKAKLHDKVGALTLAARHLGMLNDKLKIEGEVVAIVKDYTGRKDK